MLSSLLPLCILAGGGALVAGYAWAGRPLAAVASLAPAILWLVLRRRGTPWVGDAGLAAFAAAAAVGMMLDAGSIWMLTGLVAALTAWDLEAFDRWLRDTQTSEEAQALLRRHLFLVLAVDLLALGLGVLALELRVRLKLGALILLGLVLAVGLSRVVRHLRRQAEP